MAAISQANIRLVGSHAGVEIGADGPSQMALEDLAMIRAVHGSTVLYPCDATSAAALTATMADLDGISYMRTTRGAYPVLYEAGESFPVGGSKVLRESGDNQVDADRRRDHPARVPGRGRRAGWPRASAPGSSTSTRSSRPTPPRSPPPPRPPGAGWSIAEDHHPEGGLGSAVLDALTGEGRIDLAVAHLAVREMPGSGTGEELLAGAGIDAAHIADAARRLLAYE